MFDVVWWQPTPQEEYTVAIGCKKHPLGVWRGADEDLIQSLCNVGEYEFPSEVSAIWDRYGDLILSVVEATIDYHQPH